MCRREHQVLVAVNECPLLLGIGSPKDEDEVLTLFGQATYGSIGKLLPPLTLVGTCLMGLHREGSIEQQHPLACPTGEITMGRHRLA